MLLYVVLQVVCHHLVMFGGGVQSLTTTIRGAQTLAIKCSHGGIEVLINILLIKGAVYVGVVDSFEPLSLDVIRNALASLTQLGLIRQPERWGNCLLPL